MPAPRRAVLLSLVALAFAPPAHGAESDTTALVRVEASGETESDRALLDQEVRAALGKRLSLLAAPQVEATLRAQPDLGRCGDPGSDCAGKLGTALDARFLVTATVRKKDDTQSVAITVVDAARGRTVGTAEESCMLCGWAELLKTAGRAAEAAAARAAAEPPALLVKPPADTGGVKPIAILKWVELGASVALITSGATLLGLNGQCELGFQLPPEAMMGARCPLVYDTLIPGAVLTGLGVASLTASIVMLVVHRKSAGKVGVQPAVTPTSASLTLRLAF